MQNEAQVSLRARLLQEDYGMPNPGGSSIKDGISGHIKRNIGKYAGALGALGAGALAVGNEDVNNGLNHLHELDDKDELLNTASKSAKDAYHGLVDPWKGETGTATGTTSHPSGESTPGTWDNKPTRFQYQGDAGARTEVPTTQANASGNQPASSGTIKQTVPSQVPAAAAAVPPGVASATADNSDLQARLAQQKDMTNLYKTVANVQPGDSNGSENPNIYQQEEKSASNLWGLLNTSTGKAHNFDKSEISPELAQEKGSEAISKNYDDWYKTQQDLAAKNAEHVKNLQSVINKVNADGNVTPEERLQLQTAMTKANMGKPDTEFSYDDIKSMNPDYKGAKGDTIDNYLKAFSGNVAKEKTQDLANSLKWAKDNGFGFLGDADNSKVQEFLSALTLNGRIPPQLQPLIDQINSSRKY